jgi:hypothetical protein
MTNHIHLLIKENDEPISIAMKRLSGSYVYWYNQKYNRVGHLFQERYKSEIVDNDSYLLTVLRYIHQNPVKAGLCKEIKDYRWSSYNDYLRKSDLTDTTFIKSLFSEDKELATKAYCSYMLKEQNGNCMEEDKTYLPDEKLEELFRGFGLRTSKELLLLDKGRQMEILKKLKILDGVSTRQLSRATGIARSFISKL